jgi:DNA invertase Pin-like site-specific DNA recombinase
MVVDERRKPLHHEGMATTKATLADAVRAAYGRNPTTKPFAAAYLRVSGLGQVDGDGFDRQRERIRAWAKAHGVEVVAEFRDEGVSGTNELADREGLAALFDRIDSNGIRVVIVENATRLARDLMVSEVILAQFRERGVKVLSADGSVDLTENDDPTATLIRQVLGAVAQFERSVTVAKLRAARDRRSREKGIRVEGQKPFGLTDPIEKETLHRMRILRIKPRNEPRRSFATIAAILNQEGRPTRHGGPWKPESVRKILAKVTTFRVIGGPDEPNQRVVVVVP